MIELKTAATLKNGQHTGLAADHETLASGLNNVHVTTRTDAIVARFGKPAISDFYVYMDLAGAEELAAQLAEAIDWLKNPNG